MKFLVVFLLLTYVGLSMQTTIEKNTETEISVKPFCSICEQIVENLQKYFDEDLSEEGAEEKIKELCSTLGDALGQICKDTLLPTIRELYEVLDQDNPENTCKYLELC